MISEHKKLSRNIFASHFASKMKGSPFRDFSMNAKSINIYEECLKRSLVNEEN